jgi:hypothetical protein
VTLTDSIVSYPVLPNGSAGVLEVRKKGMWDMSEEERQRRLRKELPLKKRFQMGLARLVRSTFPAGTLGHWSLV